MQMFTVGGAVPPELDRKAPESLHAQISDAMRLTIASGGWPTHHRLKAEPELAKELGVSRGTLRRALSTLIEEGLLKQVPGRGTFVTETLIEPAVAQRLSTLSEDFASQGITLDTSVLEVGLVSPPAGVGRLMRLPRGQVVMRLVRIRSSESRPIALIHNYVRTDLAPGIQHVDFSKTSLFGALENDYQLKIDNARRTFSAQAASADVARALNLPAGSPVQYLEQLTFLADARAIEYSDVWIDSAALRVVTFLTRR
jgi:DNA-binding GntR family transcriptional regulator